MSKYPRSDFGFTLIEVMVALAIFATAAAMLMFSGGNSTNQTRLIKEAVLSTQVADQYLMTIYTNQRWPEKGIRGHMQTYGGYDWYVREMVVDMRKKNFRKIVVDVFLGAEPSSKSALPSSSLTSHQRKLRP